MCAGPKPCTPQCSQPDGGRPGAGGSAQAIHAIEHSISSMVYRSPVSHAEGVYRPAMPDLDTPRVSIRENGPGPGSRAGILIKVLTDVAVAPMRRHGVRAAHDLTPTAPWLTVKTTAAEELLHVETIALVVGTRRRTASARAGAGAARLGALSLRPGCPLHPGRHDRGPALSRARPQPVARRSV